jgi:hypothetical protein
MPNASVKVSCSSVKNIVPVVVDCIILVCTYNFLSLAGLEVLSLAIAWKNIPVCAYACSVVKKIKKKRNTFFIK